LKISILTVTYNSAATLRDTIESVRRQGYPDLEHVIVDGLSTDGTVDIIRSYHHITNWISEKDKGLYDAMNKAIDRSRGDIIGILNSDDLYQDSTVIARVMETFVNEHCDAVYGDLVYVDAEDTGKVVRYWKSGEYSQGAFKWGWMPPHPTFFVRRSLYEQFGRFNTELKTAADYELMLRFIHKHGARIAYVPRVLVRMRTGGASNQDLGARFRANRQDRQAWEINGLSPYWFTLYLKPLRKLTQYIIR
jgi:glycosyltransferase involved in cell wall biosynthesis